MQNIKISLVDNDFVVHAKADLTESKDRKGILDLIRHLDEDFTQGEGAYLEIDGLRNCRSRFLVSRVEA